MPNYTACIEAIAEDTNEFDDEGNINILNSVDNNNLIDHYIINQVDNNNLINQDNTICSDENLISNLEKAFSNSDLFMFNSNQS